MNKKELIELLQDVPDDAEVRCTPSGCCCCKDVEATDVDYTESGNVVFIDG